MYGAFKSVILRLVKAPTRPPDAPAGSHDSLKIYRASPRFLRYRLLVFWFSVTALWASWWILAIIALVNQELAGVLIVAPFAPILLAGQLIAYFAVRIDYDMRYYVVTDRSLRVREGAVIVKEMTISHANVQNVSVVQGPLLRLFGIWSLHVHAAGGGGTTSGGESGQGHQIQMAGIENAHEVRDLILGHLRHRGRGSGLGDLDDEAEVGAATPGVSTAVLDALRAVLDSSAALRRTSVERSAALPGDGSGE